LLQAGAPGFEPGIADPKSAALPLGHAPSDTAQGYERRLLLGGLLAPLDELRDATTALAAELRVTLATQLRLPGLATFAAELRVTARPELCLARLAALAAKLRVTLGSELALPRLSSTTADLAIERRTVLSRRRRTATLASLSDGEFAFGIHG
jgi:hypothetical protein